MNVDGTPKIIYHQTGTEFYEFSNANPRAGLNDSETPNGFFAKDNATDIGLEGNMQMAMYGDMKKPLHFKNRTEARVWYEQNIDGYEELQKQCDIVEQKFNERFEIQERFNDEYYEQNVEQCTIFGGLFNRGTYNILSLFCIICMTVHCNLGSGYRNYNQYDHLLKWV